jgi:hypothetical protein
LPSHASYAGCAGYAATVHAAVDHGATHHAAIHHAAISPATAASHQPYTFNTHDPLDTASAVKNSTSLPHCRFTGATCTVYNNSSLASVIFFHACAYTYGYRPQHTRSIQHPSVIQYTGCTIYICILAVLPF